MESKVQITDVIIRSLISRNHPAVLPVADKLKNLWPDVMTGERCEFTLSGAPTIIGNLLRVVLIGEIPTKGLSCSTENLHTSDDHILAQFITEQRIPDIPLLQSCPADAVFSLNVVNNDVSERREVLAENLTQIRGTPGKYFNSKSIICILGPGTYLNLSNIIVTTDIPSRIGRGNRRLAVNVSSIPLDDVTAPIGTANPFVSRISFNTNGTLPAKKIILAATTVITKHLEYVQKLLPGIHAVVVGNTSEYVLTVGNSYAAMGTTIVKVVTLLYPTVDFVAHDYVIAERSLTIRMRSNIAASDIFKNVIAYIEKIVSFVREYFQK